MEATDILAHITIPTPCRADWSLMQGDERARLCSRCDKHVYNLSVLTADQLVSLIREKEGNLCARIFRRIDGTIVTANCQPMAPRALTPRQLSLRSLVGIVTCCATVLGVGRLLPKDWFLPPEKPAPSNVIACPDTGEWLGGAVEVEGEWEGGDVEIAE